jgi:hypothetical protein
MKSNEKDMAYPNDATTNHEAMIHLKGDVLLETPESLRTSME